MKLCPITFVQKLMQNVIFLTLLKLDVFSLRFWLQLILDRFRLATSYVRTFSAPHEGQKIQLFLIQSGKAEFLNMLYICVTRDPPIHFHPLPPSDLALVSH